jgi:hypothetical protein
MKIDLKEIGALTINDEKFLARLIATACSPVSFPEKHHLILKARHDFGWATEMLERYVSAGLMAPSTAGFWRNNSVFLTREWLCAVFASGPELAAQHVMVIMGFLNTKIVAEDMEDRYVSGKAIWQGASPALKQVLDVLDDAACKRESVLIADL